MLFRTLCQMQVWQSFCPLLLLRALYFGSKCRGNRLTRPASKENGWVQCTQVWWTRQRCLQIFRYRKMETLESISVSLCRLMLACLSYPELCKLLVEVTTTWSESSHTRRHLWGHWLMQMMTFGWTQPGSYIWCWQSICEHPCQRHRHVWREKHHAHWSSCFFFQTLSLRGLAMIYDTTDQTAVYASLFLASLCVCTHDLNWARLPCRLSFWPKEWLKRGPFIGWNNAGSHHHGATVNSSGSINSVIHVAGMRRRYLGFGENSSDTCAACLHLLRCSRTLRAYILVGV